MTNPYKVDNDNPEWTDEMFANAVRVNDLPKSLQTKLGRPVKLNPKQAVTVRYDAEIIEYFKSQGKGWQTAMNNAPKEWIARHA